jgi:hypothetical protein
MCPRICYTNWFKRKYHKSVTNNRTIKYLIFFNILKFPRAPRNPSEVTKVLMGMQLAIPAL